MTGCFIFAFSCARSSAELLPFGHDHQRVGAGRAGIGVVAIGDIRQFVPGLFHADGIVGLHGRAEILQAR